MVLGTKELVGWSAQSHILQSHRGSVAVTNLWGEGAETYRRSRGSHILPSPRVSRSCLVAMATEGPCIDII